MPCPRRACSFRSVLVVTVICLMLSSPSPVHAKSQWGWSPGVKLGWTFGGGLTYGLELSFIRLPDLTTEPGQSLVGAAADAIGQLISETWGIVINLDTDFSKLFKMRVGGEWVGPFLGVEAGPTLVFDNRGAHLGLGITPWIGYHMYGYYTYTWLFGRAPNLHELGAYLKAPLLGFGGGSSYSDDWDD